MKIRELIEKLSKYDWDSTVSVDTRTFPREPPKDHRDHIKSISEETTLGKKHVTLNLWAIK